MAKEYKLILFDLDGTLIDTSKGIYNGLDYMLEEMGVDPIDESLKPNFVGPPVSYTYPKFFNFTGERLQKAIDLYRKHGREQGYLEFSYYPGVEELLKFLQDNGYLSVVTTMKQTLVAQKQLDVAGFTPLLTKLIGNTDVDPYTKSELIEHAIEEFDVTKDETLLVGDTGIDANGAKEAGVDFYPAMYGFGFNFKDESEDYPYVKKLSSPTDLIDILKGEQDEQI